MLGAFLLYGFLAATPPPPPPPELLLPPPPPSRPHAIVLIEGSRVEGLVLEKDSDSIYVETEEGVRRVQTALIDLAQSRIPPLRDIPEVDQIHRAFRATLDLKKAEDCARLGVWLLRRSEWRMENEEAGSGHWEGMRWLERAVEIDPECEMARTALGFWREREGWSSRPERRFLQHQRESGFVLFQSKWVSVAEQARLQEPPVPSENEDGPGERSVWDLNRQFGSEAPLNVPIEKLRALWDEQYKGKPVSWRGWLDEIVDAKKEPHRVPAEILRALSAGGDPPPAKRVEWRDQADEDAEGLWIFQVKFVKSGGWDPAKVPGGLWRHDRVWVLLIVRGGPGKRLDGFREGDPVGFTGRLTTFAREAGRIFFAVEADTFDVWREFIRPPILDPMAPRHPEVPPDPKNPEFPPTPAPRKWDGKWES